MSLQSYVLPRVPEDTARAARAAFKKGNVYLTISDELGLPFSTIDFSPLYAKDGAPAVSPVRLALALVFAFMEDLSDRAAADAVRSRIDWKYALRLGLDDAGFDFSVLADFRERLLAHDGLAALFAAGLRQLGEAGLLRAGGTQRTDATHVLAATRTLSRLDLVAETLRLALEAVGEADPTWLRAMALPHWYERYQHALTTFRLPRAKAKREVLALEIGRDGFHLLDHVARPQTPQRLAELAAVTRLQQVWTQQFERSDENVSWRPSATRVSATELICTPHDSEARFSQHGTTAWTGYQVHWTETCETTHPHLITHVETTAATTPHVKVVDTIHTALAEAKLLPHTHLLDGGYRAAHIIATSREQHGVTALGPVEADTTWQARTPDGLTNASFQIDWDGRQATCPAGHPSVTWSPSQTVHGQPVVHIQFAAAVCAVCPLRERCTRATTRGRALQLSLHHDVLVAARQQQQTAAFKEAYAVRAGIEGTVSATVRVHGARRTRYIGQTKTHAQAVLTALAVNFKRAAVWLMGQRPKGTRAPGLGCLAPNLLGA